MVITIVAILLHLPNCLLFVYKLDFGISGLAMASSCKDLLCIASLIVYSNCSKQVSGRLQTFWQKDTFNGLKEYLDISLPATVMICAEWWGFEILALIAGTIGVASQASWAIVVTTCAIALMIAKGMQEATCSIIGNCIGAGNVPLAKRFFALIMRVSIAVTILISMSILLARDQIAAVFSTDEEVRRIVSTVLILLSFNFLFDGF
jgi:multidrug resistance protein, MATE family